MAVNLCLLVICHGCGTHTACITNTLNGCCGVVAFPITEKPAHSAWFYTIYIGVQRKPPSFPSLFSRHRVSATRMRCTISPPNRMAKAALFPFSVLYSSTMRLRGCTIHGGALKRSIPSCSFFKFVRNSKKGKC